MSKDINYYIKTRFYFRGISDKAKLKYKLSEKCNGELYYVSMNSSLLCYLLFRLIDSKMQNKELIKRCDALIEKTSKLLDSYNNKYPENKL